MPDDLLRRPKHGFGLPLGEWFRSDLRERVADVRCSTRRGWARACAWTRCGGCERAPLGRSRPRPRAVDAPGAGAVDEVARLRVSADRATAAVAEGALLAALVAAPWPFGGAADPVALRACAAIVLLACAAFALVERDIAAPTLRLAQAAVLLPGLGARAGRAGPGRRLARLRRGRARPGRPAGRCSCAGAVVERTRGARPAPGRGARGGRGPGRVRRRAVGALPTASTASASDVVTAPFGSFVNHNHFAGLVEMGAVLAAGSRGRPLAPRRRDAGGPGSHGPRAGAGARAPGEQEPRWRLLALLAGFALLAAASRRARGRLPADARRGPWRRAWPGSWAWGCCSAWHGPRAIRDAVVGRARRVGQLSRGGGTRDRSACWPRIRSRARAWAPSSTRWPPGSGPTARCASRTRRPTRWSSRPRPGSWVSPALCLLAIASVGALRAPDARPRSPIAATSRSRAACAARRAARPLAVRLRPAAARARDRPRFSPGRGRGAAADTPRVARGRIARLATAGAMAALALCAGWRAAGAWRLDAARRITDPTTRVAALGAGAPRAPVPARGLA